MDVVNMFTLGCAVAVLVLSVLILAKVNKKMEKYGKDCTTKCMERKGCSNADNACKSSCNMECVDS